MQLVIGDCKMKCPCKECITLAICINKDEIQCPILFKYIDKCRLEYLTYPTWDGILKELRVALKGAWYPMAINDTTYAVKKNHYGANTDEG